jgi:hypothetical protein
LVATYARQLCRLDFFDQDDKHLCHPVGTTVIKSARIHHRALLHQRICLIRMVQNNKNTLECVQTSGAHPWWKLDDDASLKKMQYMNLIECPHLKWLRLRIPNSISMARDNGRDALCKLLENKINALSTVATTTTITTPQQVVPLEELELPLCMLYSFTNNDADAVQLRQLLVSTTITSSLRRLKIQSDGAETTSPRTFDNIISHFTNLSSLDIGLDENVSFDASTALAKLTHLQKLVVTLSSFTYFIPFDLIYNSSLIQPCLCFVIDWGCLCFKHQID